MYLSSKLDMILIPNVVLIIIYNYKSKQRIYRTREFQILIARQYIEMRINELGNHVLKDKERLDAV